MKCVNCGQNPILSVQIHPIFNCYGGGFDYHYNIGCKSFKTYAEMGKYVHAVNVAMKSYKMASLKDIMETIEPHHLINSTRELPFDFSNIDFTDEAMGDEWKYNDEILKFCKNQVNTYYKKKEELNLKKNKEIWAKEDKEKQEKKDKRKKQIKIGLVITGVAMLWFLFLRLF